MIDFAKVRRMMVDNQLRTYDITDLGVLSAMNEVPRERFLPPELGLLAYTDRPLEAARAADGSPRHLLAPMVFARMAQNLRLRPGERVLVVGGGLGYEAAALAKLGPRVVAVEPDEGLAARARALLAEVPHGPGSVEVVEAPFDRPPAGEPFDAIYVNGAAEKRPQALLEALAEGGRLGVVLGDGSRTSRATLFVRAGDAYGARALYDAAAPVLAPFREEPGFVF